MKPRWLPPVLAAVAVGRGMKGDLAGVIADCSEALKLKPDLADALVTRGQAYLQGGDRAGAAADFAQALRIAPPGWTLRPRVEDLLRQAREPR